MLVLKLWSRDGAKSRGFNNFDFWDIASCIYLLYFVIKNNHCILISVGSIWYVDLRSWLWRIDEY